MKTHHKCKLILNFSLNPEHFCLAFKINQSCIKVLILNHYQGLRNEPQDLILTASHYLPYLMNFVLIKTQKL